MSLRGEPRRVVRIELQLVMLKPGAVDSKGYLVVVSPHIKNMM